MQINRMKARVNRLNFFKTKNKMLESNQVFKTKSIAKYLRKKKGLIVFKNQIGYQTLLKLSCVSNFYLVVSSLDWNISIYVFVNYIRS